MEKNNYTEVDDRTILFYFGLMILFGAIVYGGGFFDFLLPLLFLFILGLTFFLIVDKFYK